MSADADEGCPYCGSTNDCKHLLLLVDATFRSAEGGVLMDTFNRRWAAMRAADPETNEQEPFDELLSEVDSLADASGRYSPDSMPGMSSAYQTFFVSSATRARAATKEFKAAG